MLPLFGICILAGCTMATSTGAGPAGSSSSVTAASAAPPGTPAASLPAGAEKLQHLIFIIQENRSFDHYFGTYPGADGFPVNPDGSFAVCIPDVWQHGKCVTPYVTHSIEFDGAPHNEKAAKRDINHGRMDGFTRSLVYRPEKCWVTRTLSQCDRFLGPDGQPDVMSTLGRASIPNYWKYADEFVLQDHLFASTDSWTLPSHLFIMSAWSASCTDPTDPMSCRSDLVLKSRKTRWDYGDKPIHAWTDITWLLDHAGIQWRYYIGADTCWEPPCPGIHSPDYSSKAALMPIAGFTSFWDGERDGIEDNIQDVHRFIDAAKKGTLPQVSWIVPASTVSDHPGSSSNTRTAMAYVTTIINAAMQSPEWDSTAIFLAWDDWGGFYDHVAPPKIDQNGYGIRVPGLLISPYANAGSIDHTTLSFDSYLKLIEDRFLGGARLDPATDGRPDSRPTVREPLANDLWKGFDFDQAPLAPLILDPWPWAAPEPHRLF